MIDISRLPERRTARAAVPAVFPHPFERTRPRGSDGTCVQPASAVWLLSGALLCQGCVAPTASVPTVSEQAGLRAMALKTIEEAAFGEKPALRIHALEAFAEAAPREGLACLAIPLNVESLYHGTCFAALLAAGRAAELGPLDEKLASDIRTRAESPNGNVRAAAIYGLHKMGDTSRTGDLAELVLHHKDPSVRANAALVLGKLGEPSSIKLLQTALRREEKTLPKLQILESLAMLGDDHAANRLMFEGRSEVAQQCEVALSLLANAGHGGAEELFLYRFQTSPYPEIKLQAARGLARLGSRMGVEYARDVLRADHSSRSFSQSPAEQTNARLRVLAALVLEQVGEPDALADLRRILADPKQDASARIAVARATIRIIERARPIAEPATVVESQAGPAGTEESAAPAG